MVKDYDLLNILVKESLLNEKWFIEISLIDYFSDLKTTLLTIFGLEIVIQLINFCLFPLPWPFIFKLIMTEYNLQDFKTWLNEKPKRKDGLLFWPLILTNLDENLNINNSLKYIPKVFYEQVIARYKRTKPDYYKNQLDLVKKKLFEWTEIIKQSLKN